MSHNPELVVETLTDDKIDNGDEGSHWVEVGATVSDSEGHKYDLLSIVAYLLEQYPYLMQKDIENLIDKNHLFAVNVGSGRPKLAVAFKEILPILQNLSHLLSQDDRKIDRYDAHQLFALGHTQRLSWGIAALPTTGLSLAAVFSPN